MMLFTSRSDPSDTIYLRLRDDPTFADLRTRMEQLYRQFKPFADDNFEAEFQKRVIPRFWEMYLACALIDGGFGLIPRKNRPPGGPDICIDQGGSRIWVEAVAPEVGEGPDRVPAQQGDTELFSIVPEDQITLRFCSVIDHKFRKHSDYLKKGLVGSGEPFVIAVNGADIPNAAVILPGDVPYAIRAVLPIGPLVVTIDRKTGTKVKEEFARRNRIPKLSEKVVPTDLFLEPNYGTISALLFSNVHPFSFDRATLDGVSLLHNGSAQQRLPMGWLKAGVEYWVDGGLLRWKLTAPSAGADGTA